jgi:protein translocase SecG subunit
MFTLLLIIFVLDLILLIPIILLQSGSGAQAGVFGGDMTFGAFGAKTSEVLVNMTKWLVGIFLAAAFLLGYIKVQETKAYTGRPQQQQQSSGDNNPSSSVSQDTNGFTNQEGLKTNR